MTRTVLTGMIAFSALHLGYHTARHGSLAGTDLALSLVSLILRMIIPLGLLATTRRARAPRGQQR